jgi:hypothetical protein
MKRVKAIIGYSLVIGMFVALLALELMCIAVVIVSAVGIITLVKLPTSPGDVLMSLWRAAMVILFGSMAGLGAFLTFFLPYDCVTAWISSARRSPTQAEQES